MGKLLSHTLADLGFFLALGTTESFGGSEALVGARTPNTTGSNNGVTVVYDEQGCPWIIRNRRVTEVLKEALRGFCLERGAYVPHSNDGGQFVIDVLKM